METDEEEGTDGAALKDGAVSVTPIHYDMTDYANLDMIREWKLTK